MVSFRIGTAPSFRNDVSRGVYLGSVYWVALGHELPLLTGRFLLSMQLGTTYLRVMTKRTPFAMLDSCQLIFVQQAIIHRSRHGSSSPLVVDNLRVPHER